MVIRRKNVRDACRVRCVRTSGTRQSSLNGRKEWYCGFCIAAKVETRAKCQRCKTDIPTGLHGKHVQAWSTKKQARLRRRRKKNQQCSSKRHVRRPSLMIIVRWRWLSKQTVAGSWGCGKRDHEAFARNRRVSRTWRRASRKVTRKSGSKELLQIEHWRNDLLPDHEKMQKMSQKLQCLQEKMLQCKKKSRASGPKELKRSGPRSSSCKRNWRTMRRRS